MYKEPKNLLEVLAKLVILGSAASGKSALRERAEKNLFKTKYTSTIGVDFSTLTKISSDPTNNVILNFQIWSTSGNEQYKALLPMYISNAACVIVTCDLTCRESFEEIDQWIDLAKTYAPNAPILLVGTKSDLVDVNNPKITENELNGKVQEHGCIGVIKTSSKNDENVDEVFQKCADTYWDKHPPKQAKKSVSKAFSAGAPSLAFSKNTNNRSQAIDYFTTQKHIKLVEHFEKLWTKELKHPHKKANDQDAEKIIQLLRNYAKFNKSFSIYKFTRNHVSEVETIINDYISKPVKKNVLKQQLDALTLKNSAGTLAALIHFVGEKLDKNKKELTPLKIADVLQPVDADKHNTLIYYYSGFRK